MGTRLKLALAIMAGMALAAGAGNGAWAADAQVTPSGSGQDRQLDPDLPGVEPQDQKFAETALATLEPAVELSKLGAEKASNPDVVALSEKMAKRYAELAGDLKAAVGAADVKVADGKAPHIDNRLDRLKDANSEFDLTYLTEQRGVHKKLISVYTMEARSGEKEPLRAHAEAGKQVFTENAKEIERLEGQLAGERTTPGR
jgi:predicted outer membrane protein